MAAKLTPEDREKILARIAAGASYQEAADWCLTALGKSIRKQSIGELVSKHRSERAEISKAVARDHIARTLPADLTAADEKHATAAALVDAAANEALSDGSVAAFEKYSKAAMVFLKFEELKRKTLGLDQPDVAFLDNVVDLAGLALAAEDEAARAVAFGDANTERPAEPDEPSGSDESDP